MISFSPKDLFARLDISAPVGLGQHGGGQEGSPLAGIKEAGRSPLSRFSADLGWPQSHFLEAEPEGRRGEMSPVSLPHCDRESFFSPVFRGGAYTCPCD